MSAAGSSAQGPAQLRPEAIDDADRAGAFAIFALLVALYTLTFSGLPDNPDAEVEFQTVHSLAQHGSLALSDTPEARAIVAARFDVRPGGPGREQRWYAWFGVGQALVALPFYAAGACLERGFPEVETRHASFVAYGAQRSEYWRHLAVGWRNPLLAAATAALLFFAARRLGAARGSASLAAVLFGTATFAWPQARSTLSDVQGTFFLCLAFERWLRCRRESPGRMSALGIGGAALALAVLTRVALAPAACVIAVAYAASLLQQRAKLRECSAFLVPLIAGGGLFLLANERRFGSVFETGYGTALAGGTFFSSSPLPALAGLLISPGKGLVWMAPLLLLVPVGWRLSRARGERVWPWLAAAAAAAVIAPVVFTQSWHGAWTYGPRYVLPIVPLLWPAVALAFDCARKRRGVFIAALALALLGLATSLPGVLVDHMTHQDLALQGARIEWPDPGGLDERERDDERFLRIQWDWSFAAPWAHWRIAKSRALGAQDEYSPRELFGVESDALIHPQHARELGWNHLAWVDMKARLDGPFWIGPLFAALWLAMGAWAWRTCCARLVRPEGGPRDHGAQARNESPR